MNTEQIIRWIIIAFIAGLLLIFVDRSIFKSKFIKKIVKQLKLIVNGIIMLIKKIPYRIVNINKYRKTSDYKDILIKITMSIDSFASPIFYWNIIPNGNESKEFDSLQEVKHNILSTYPNIDIFKETKEQSWLFPKRFLYCKTLK